MQPFFGPSFNQDAGHQTTKWWQKKGDLSTTDSSKTGSENSGLASKYVNCGHDQLLFIENKLLDPSQSWMTGVGGRFEYEKEV